MQPPLSSAPDLGDAFLRGAEAAHAITSLQQFFVWLRLHLHRFVPHELALCWSAGPQGASAARVHVLNCVPLPDDMRRQLEDPTARWWYELAQSWMRADDRAGEMAGTPQLQAAGFGPAWVHGVRRPASPAPDLLLVFLRHGHGAPPMPTPRVLAALELWMPYLHFAWSRAEITLAGAPGTRAATGPALTARELQVLTAVRDAKANAQIGALLGISPLTVKNHLRSIQRKLGARNRAHAVAEAMARRLIT